MAVSIMTAVWTSPLPIREKMVMLILADWANDSGQVQGTLTEVSALASLPAKEVEQVVVGLVSSGVLLRYLHDEGPGFQINSDRITAGSCYGC